VRRWGFSFFLTMNNRGLATAVPLHESTTECCRHTQAAIPQEDGQRRGGPERHSHKLLIIRRAPEHGGNQQERRQEREDVEADEADPLRLGTASTRASYSAVAKGVC
jgi:hypothetical protein